MKRGNNKTKKGLSPVIASVLLLALVFVLAALIFLFLVGFLGEQISKAGEPIDKLCAALNYEVAKIDNTDQLEVVNRGDISIYHLDIKMFDGEGNSEVSKFKFSIDAGESTTGKVYLHMEDGTRPETITVYPALIGTVEGKPQNRVFTCTDVGQTITL